MKSQTGHNFVTPAIFMGNLLHAGVGRMRRGGPIMASSRRWRGESRSGVDREGRKIPRWWVAGLTLVAVQFLPFAVAHAGAVAPYTLDSKQSLLRVYVYRAGLLGILGHDHLITATAIDGGLSYTPSPAPAATFKLVLPVAALMVDDPQQRNAVGGRFRASVSTDDRAATRRNMLGEKVLDAARYPTVTVSGTWIAASSSRGTAAVTVEAHGQRRDFTVPVAVQLHKDRLSATGTFHLRQTQIGITPLNVLGGMIQVANGMDIHFSLTFVPVIGQRQSTSP